ncbi:MAG: hypothetical protein IKQ70_06605 [Bacteroidales bacterium]|nr:hypothetical protein [Bacteroidales bacterium]
MSNYQYTTIKMQQLRQMSKTPSIFDVLECQVMTDLGINALYFTKIDNISVLDDYPDTVKYQLKAKSIEPAEFTLND